MLRLSSGSCMLRLRLSFRGSGGFNIDIQRQPMSRRIRVNPCHVSPCHVMSDPCRSVSSRIQIKPRPCRAVSSRPRVHARRAVSCQTAACPRVRALSAPPCIGLEVAVGCMGADSQERGTILETQGS